MKRALLFGVLFIIADQAIKFGFQHYFCGVLYFGDTGFGFTNITNPGIYLNAGISASGIFLLQAVELTAMVFLYFFISGIKKRFRTGILVDISFGLFTVALTGNLLLDRLFLGYIRDYLITPLGVANLADFAASAALIVLASEFIRVRYFSLDRCSEMVCKSQRD